MVLVNDFGSVGVDGSLLSGRGADVVELPNGCICCSLRTDLARQMREVVAKWSPQRLLIEPSGVAEVTQLLKVLNRPDLSDVVKSIRVYTLVNAGEFLREYARAPHYFEAQTAVAPLLIINKADTATPAQMRTIDQTLRAINPRAQIVPATYGIVDDSAVLQGLPEASIFASTALADDEHEHEHEHDHEEALGLHSWSAIMPGVYDEQALQGVLRAATAGDFGEVLRMKGILQVQRGGVHFALVGAQTGVAAFAPREGEQPRVVAIGHSVYEAQLQKAFEACRVLPAEQPSFIPATA